MTFSPRGRTSGLRNPCCLHICRLPRLLAYSSLAGCRTQPTWTILIGWKSRFARTNARGGRATTMVSGTSCPVLPKSRQVRTNAEMPQADLTPLVWYEPLCFPTTAATDPSLWCPPERPLPKQCDVLTVWRLGHTISSPSAAPGLPTWRPAFRGAPPWPYPLHRPAPIAARSRPCLVQSNPHRSDRRPCTSTCC